MGFRLRASDGLRPEARSRLEARSLKPDATAAAAVALVIVLRSAVFVLFEQAHFDSDQAVVGLAAKHLAELRAFPLFMYGQDYMLAVESWLAAPLFALGGPSVALLKLPLVALNVVAAALLLWFLRRDAGLSRVAAIAATLYVALPGVVTASRLVEAGGGNIEPFVWVLLIWAFRTRPVLLGLAAAIGFLNREFTAYGIVALVLVDVATGALFVRRRLAGYAIAGVTAIVVFVSAALLRPLSSATGPGTHPEQAGPRAIAGRLCYDLTTVAGNVRWVLTRNLPTLFGSGRDRIGAFLRTRHDGVPRWLWPVLVAGWFLLAVRIAVLVARRAAADMHQRLEFPMFLFVVGGCAVGAYLLGCTVRDGMLLRYTLLALLVPVALTAGHLALERHTRWRTIAVGIAVLAAATDAAGHVRLAAEYCTRPPQNLHRALADHLEERGIRFGFADYWDSYVVTFLTHERVILASDEPMRISEYMDRALEHRTEAVTIQRAPCRAEDASEVFGPWRICSK